MEQASFSFETGSLEIGTAPIVPAPGMRPGTVGGTAQTPRILTVSEAVRAAKGRLEEEFGDVWVVGEVSGFRPSNAGHCYFDLKDDACVLPAVCFRHVALGFPFKIENGMALICHGQLSIYEKGGKFQIIVDSAEPKGIGALQLAFEQLKKRLEAEGLFDPRRKKSLPFCPRRVGVVTSPTGAAIRDIVHVLQRRFPNIEVTLAPTRVQGAGAAEEIAAAIRLLDLHGACDVLIVGRGGGSMEDLWAFNEEVVARAISAATTPIVSAVGHEIDFTIADFVADVRAPTPSAAAEIVVPARQELLAAVRERRAQLTGALTRAWERQGTTWHQWWERLKPPTARFRDWSQQIDSCRERMIFAMRAGWEQRRGQFGQLAAELQHLSPLAVLAKGYAVVTKKGTMRPITRIADVTGGDRVDIRFAEGVAEAVIV